MTGRMAGKRTGKEAGKMTGRRGREEDRKEERAKGREEGVFRQVFGTGTNPTGTPVAFRRGEEGLLAGLWHGDLAHRYSSGIPAWRKGRKSVPLT